MLKNIEKCESCGKPFEFDTSQCSQIVFKQEYSDSSIIFLPKCPHCQCINKLELPWDECDGI